MLSFLSVSESGSGSTLPDPDPLVRGMDPDPDPDPNPSMRLLQKSECLQGPISINVGRVRVVEFMKMPVEAIRVLLNAVRVIWEPKEAAKSIQHSHGFNNTLTAVRKYL